MKDQKAIIDAKDEVIVELNRKIDSLTKESAVHEGLNAFISKTGRAVTGSKLVRSLLAQEVSVERVDNGERRVSLKDSNGWDRANGQGGLLTVEERLHEMSLSEDTAYLFGKTAQKGGDRKYEPENPMTRLAMERRVMIACMR